MIAAPLLIVGGMATLPKPDPNRQRLALALVRRSHRQARDPNGDETPQPAEATDPLAYSFALQPHQDPQFVNTSSETPQSSYGAEQLSATVPAEGFRLTLGQMKDVVLDDEEYDGDFLRPTWDAFLVAFTVITEAFPALQDDFPRGSASPDGEGGLRITWERGDRDVRLVCPGRDPASGYIYHDDGKVYDGVYDLNGATLVRWLKWLQEG